MFRKMLIALVVPAALLLSGAAPASANPDVPDLSAETPPPTVPMKLKKDVPRAHATHKAGRIHKHRHHHHHHRHHLKHGHHKHL